MIYISDKSITEEGVKSADGSQEITWELICQQTSLFNVHGYDNVVKVVKKLLPLPNLCSYSKVSKIYTLGV